MEDDPKTIGTAPSTEEAEHLARSFAMAVRNVSVYPTDHPRSQSAAEDCLKLVRGRGGIVMTVFDNELHCNGLQLGREPHVAWLIERVRNATLRGIVVSPHCTGKDLLDFARGLVAARRGGTGDEAFHWPDDHPRLRALPLVFTGTFGGTGPVGPQTATGNTVGDSSPAPAGTAPGTVGGEGGPVTIPMGPIEDSVLDLLSEVVDDAAKEALREALADRVIDSATGALEDESDLVDTTAIDKLRLSANIAQRYFARPGATADVEQEKPSGRPEDAGIQADVEELMAEIAALPPAADPGADPEAMAACQPGPIARQLVGVYIYLFVSDPDEEARAKLAIPMRRAIAALPGDRSDILDVYLGGGGDFRALSEDADRLALLELIGQAGKHDLIRESGYLDAKLVVTGFPDCMPLAARALGTTPEGLTILREAVDMLNTQHGTSSFMEIMREKGLQDPEVVRAFIDVGGECANAALTAIAWGGRLELYSVLVEHLEQLVLPAAERKALAALRPKDPGAASYLQQLFKEAQTSVSKDLRLRSGEVLRRVVQQARSEDDTTALLAAIEDLALVPDDKTRELLKDLGSHGGWTGLFGRQAAARTKAREVLKSIGTRRP